MPSNDDNNDNNQSSRGGLEQEALAWIVRLTSGEATAADRDAFMRWRSRGPQHEAAALDAMRLWHRVGSATQRAPRLASRRLFLRGGAMAASVAGLAFAGSKLGFLPTFQDFLADYKTVAGEQRRLTLPGDITVELNTRSGLSLDRQKGNGHLTLVSGEAAFTSDARAGSFLSVSAGHAVVSASGAVLSVRLEGTFITVSCLEGRAEMLAPQALRLDKGQQVICNGERVVTQPIANIDGVAAWRKGQLIFRDEPLSRVAEELNRYKKGLVVVVDDAAARRRVTGVFHLGRVDEALDHIGGALNLPVRHLSPFLTLIG